MAKPHLLVVPFPEQGHVIPLMELSLCLVKHGIKITFVNTEYNHRRIISTASRKNMNGTDEQLCLVPIPDGLKSSSDIISRDKRIEAAMKTMPASLEELIGNINCSESEKITCILVDQSVSWVLDIAEKKGIRQRAALCPAAAANLVIANSIPELIDSRVIDKQGVPLGKQIIRLSPTMPSLSTENLLWVRIPNLDTRKLIFQLFFKNSKSMKAAQWLLCNSTDELEDGAFTLAPQIVPIGPLLASNRLGDPEGHFWSQDLTCLKWLDKHSPKSVIYVSFGSITTFSPQQFQELALGLELCNRPFLWAVRPDIKEGTNDAYPKGFQNTTSNMGYAVSWAPQQKILGHPSVACFISHCGWNSTIEGVSNGISFLCWPHSSDQFLNQSYICDVWKIGLKFDGDENGLITQNEIKTKVDQLMSDKGLKARALELKDKVLNNIKHGGRSSQNLNNFIQWIKS